MDGTVKKDHFDALSHMLDAFQEEHRVPANDLAWMLLSCAAMSALVVGIKPAAFTKAAREAVVTMRKLGQRRTP